MKPRKVTYVVFVTGTLLSAMLLFTAIHLTDPVIMKYQTAISRICASHSQLETEADALAAFPQLSTAKEKIETLKELRCELQRMETSAAYADEAQRGKEIQASRERAKLLVQEINALLLEVEKHQALAQRL